MLERGHSGIYQVPRTKSAREGVSPRCAMLPRDRRTTTSFHKRRKKMACKEGNEVLTHWCEDIFCMGKDQVLCKVPSKEDIHQILYSCHNDVCGGHFAHELTCRKVLQAGFAWPSLHRDAHFWCKTCDAFQCTGPR